MGRTRWIGLAAAAALATLLARTPVTAEESRPAAAPPERTLGSDPAGLEIAVSPDGRRLAAMSRAGRVVVWDVASAAPLASADVDAAPRDLVFSDSGDRVFAELGAPGLPSRVVAFDASTAKPVREWRSRDSATGLRGAVRLAGVVRSEGAVGVHWLGERPELFFTGTCEPSAAPALPQEATRFFATRDGARLLVRDGVVARKDGRRLWTAKDAAGFAGRSDVRLGAGDALSLAGLAEGASVALFHTAAPGPRFVICALGLDDGKPRWLLADANLLAAPEGPSPYVVVARGTNVDLVDARTGEPVRTLVGNVRTAAAALAPDGAWAFVLADERGTIRAIPTAAPPGAPRPSASGDDAKRTPSRPPTRSLGSPATACAVSADGRLVAVAGGARVVVWEIDAARPLREFDAAGASVAALAFTGDGTTLLAGTDAVATDRAPEILAWDVATGARRATIRSRRAGGARTAPGTMGVPVGDVFLVPTGGPREGALVRQHDEGFSVFDPGTGEPLLDEARVETRPGEPGSGRVHFLASAGVAFDGAGTRTLECEWVALIVKSWPERQRLRTLGTSSLPKEVSDLRLWRAAWCGAGDLAVCEGTRVVRGSREDVLFLVDVAAKELRWAVAGASLLDSSAGERGEVLVATKRGVEWIDAASAKGTGSVVSPGGDGAIARLVPGRRLAIVVRGKSGTVSAIDLPE